MNSLQIEDYARLFTSPMTSVDVGDNFFHNLEKKSKPRFIFMQEYQEKVTSALIFLK